jgi:citrate lyase subunit beta/citryl-CoA lyase
MQNAPQLGADGLILDLEDSVPHAEKPAAREAVARMTPVLDEAGLAIFVRVNDLGSGLIEDDLAAVVRPGIYGVLLPKTDSANDILRLDAMLARREEAAGIRSGSVLIMPGIETAEGIRDARDITAASPRVAHVGMGHMKAGDAARALGFQWTRKGKETLFVRASVLLDARAGGDPYPCAGPWSDIADLEGLRSYLVEMRQLGYTGFTGLHPTHIPVANEVFTPSAEEIESWRGIIRTMEEAEREGRAAVIFEGQMIDIAMQKTARDMLDMARKAGLLPG